MRILVVNLQSMVTQARFKNLGKDKAGSPTSIFEGCLTKKWLLVEIELGAQLPDKAQ